MSKGLPTTAEMRSNALWKPQSALSTPKAVSILTAQFNCYLCTGSGHTAGFDDKHLTAASGGVGSGVAFPALHFLTATDGKPEGPG